MESFEKYHTNLFRIEDSYVLLDKIIQLIHEYNGVDFSEYKKSTISRRIEKRMIVNGKKSLEEYFDFLNESKNEKEQLYQDILIGVTGFFRDSEAFQALYEKAIPLITENAEKEIRIWSVACSTGEEAYSLAILLDIFCSGNQIEKKYKIFATDIDEGAISTAQKGIYSEEALSDMSPKIIKEYFTKRHDKYHINEKIRKNVFFAHHDMISDAPFSKIDLIVCRNVLIYINADYQKVILSTFYKMLNEKGCLFLGSSESVNAVGQVFIAIDRKWKLYQKDPSKADEIRYSFPILTSLKTLHKPKENEVSELLKEEVHIENVDETDKIKILEEALEESNASLKRAIDELREKNEELHASNEEMEVSNEELQAANEEMQSVNEELCTVNSEYQNKIAELTNANTDFDNLLSNAEVGALYIDKQKFIRKITPIMIENTNLQESDVGRSITHMIFMDEYPKFMEDINACLEKNTYLEKEVQIRGITWLLRTRPYYVEENRVEGVLVLLFDITKRLEAAKYELKMLTDSIPGGVAKFRYDNGLILEYGNEGLYRMIGENQTRKIREHDNHYESAMHPDAWFELDCRIKESIADGEMLRMEYKVVDNDKVGWRLMQALVLENTDKPILQSIITDITEQKETQSRLNSTIQKLDIVVELSADMLFEYDIKTDTMKYDRQGNDVVHTEAYAEKYVKKIDEMEFYHPDDYEIMCRFCNDLRNGSPNFFYELRRLYSDNRFHWIELVGKTIYDEAGNPDKVIGKICNIDERKGREEHLRARSEKDSLTGLYNNRVSKEHIIKRLKYMREGEKYCLLICDIDNFKHVNDTNGHLFGDAVICSFADELKSLFPNAIKGRIGGDEFVLLVCNHAEDIIRDKLTLLNDQFRQLYEKEDSMGEISCSIGGIWIDYENRDFDKAFRWADYALYQVKYSGKKGYVILDNDEIDELPDYSYLNKREKQEQYVRREALISNDEELVLFALELLDTVPDMRTCLKIIANRICKYFNFDDIIIISKETLEDGQKMFRLLFHWGNMVIEQFEQRVVDIDVDSWSKIETMYQGRNSCVLSRSDMQGFPGLMVGSILFFKAKEQMDDSNIVLFLDRANERDWSIERGCLERLSNIFLSRIQQMKEAKKHRENLEYQMNYDKVTGLPNYSYFLQVAEAFLRERRKKEFRYYFVYSDFSNFQYLNELYGYAVGDAVLKRFAQGIEKDVKISRCATRVTSDHFITLVECPKEMDIAKYTKRIAESFCDMINREYQSLNLFLVCGINEIKDEFETISTEVDYANVARKYGKKKEHTASILYNATIKDENEKQMEITAGMVAALENKEFCAYLQPKVCLKTNKVVGAEALVRWKKADGTMVYPDQFIPVFERNGFIKNIDFYVLESVLQFLKKEIEEGNEVVPVSINFSRQHNEDPEFVQNVLSLIKKYNIPPRLIEAEITESVFVNDFALLQNTVKRLQDEGIAISIDDFGSGYSSLNVLSSITANFIKLDRQFLSWNKENIRFKDFLNQLIVMIKQLGYEIVAEGVETIEQVNMLRDAGCNIVQGFHYAKPMPVEEFKKFIKEFNKE